jgi:hypothetical protein
LQLLWSLASAPDFDARSFTIDGSKLQLFDPPHRASCQRLASQFLQKEKKEV